MNMSFFFAPVDVFVGRLEIVFVRLGMHLGPLEQVLGRDRVELPRGQLQLGRLVAHDLLRADGGADEEIVGEGVLQRGRFGGDRVDAATATSNATIDAQQCFHGGHPVSRPIVDRRLSASRRACAAACRPGPSAISSVIRLLIP